MASTTEQVKARLSVVDVLSGYLKLEKAGASFKARCPFHSEKTASFFISPARDSWHCFGCAKGGDIFTFVQEVEGLDFRGALKLLADRAGVVLSNEKSGGVDEREILYAITGEAVGFYQEALKRSGEARLYLRERGVSEESIENFRIGFAPDGWRNLLENMKSRRFSDADLLRTGLFVESAKGMYDRFRGRIMFPIFDPTGKPIGFSGRILPALAGNDGQTSKYINPPQTEIYNKSKALYGINLAKQAIRTEDAVILVEGQLDVVLSHQADATNTVAVSGTALTEDHLVFLSRFSKNLLMAFDADSAGLSAATRAVKLALPLELELKIVKIPSGKDPADIAKEDPINWKKMITDARHIIDFFLENAREQNTDDREFLLVIEKDVVPYISLVSSSFERAHFVKKISDRAGIAESIVWETMRKQPGTKTIQAPFFNKNIPSNNSPSTPSFLSRTAERLLGLILWIEKEPQAEISSVEIENKLRVLLGDDYAKRRELANSDSNRLIFETEQFYRGSEKLSLLIEELLFTIEEELLKISLNDIMVKLRGASGGIAITPETASDQFLAECQKITKRLHELKLARARITF